MTPRPARHVNDKQVTALLRRYRSLDAMIIKRRAQITGLQAQQNTLLGELLAAGLTYREIAPLIGIAKTRVHQLTTKTPQ